MDAPEQRREFVERYIACLSDLTFNSKPQINSLTSLASENPAAASSVAAAIEHHIQNVRMLQLSSCAGCV